MLEVEPTDQRGSMATGSGRNCLDFEKLTRPVSPYKDRQRCKHK